MTAHDVLISRIRQSSTYTRPRQPSRGKSRSLSSVNELPLFPVKAIERCPQATEADTNSLFGYYHNGPKGRVNLTKRRVNQILAAAWHDLGRPQLSGHSFRVEERHYETQ
ncbi:hypothetical protein KEM48_001801 [Puccinia striiformis f. sp. tritici PST-130]|nr:hypothetical protein KEM48_001801 [Puccinia striiformis f. sp. tritici PST-130]